MNTQNIKAIHLCAIATILVSAGCSPSPVSTPPAPDMAGGVYVHVAYEYFHWQEGLDVMIWYDAAQSSSCDSSGGTSAKTHVVQCQAISNTGQNLDWQIETSDGLTGEFTLNNDQFDLSEGNVFVVSTVQYPIEIRQFQRDLSSVEPESERITEFGLNDPDIAEFIWWASWKSYANSTFGLGFRYPSSWFGPDEYVSDQNLRVEVGSDKIYPYGEQPEQPSDVKNSYNVVIQYTKSNQNPYWKDAYQSLQNLEDGESLSGTRSLIIRVRQLDLGRFKGFEYISTLLETAQAEHVYAREVMLFDEQTGDLLTIMGQPNNVEVSSGANWRDVYQTIDETNSIIFHAIVESISVGN